MSSHIIVTTDFSEESERAFAPIVKLANLLHAKITLLHVVEDRHETPHPAQMATPPSEKVAEAKAHIAEVSSRFPDGVDVETVVETSPDTAERVCSFAENCGADFIGLSSHGRSGFKRLIMGSFAELILRHSTRPVLVYPPPSEDTL